MWNSGNLEITKKKSYDLLLHKIKEWINKIGSNNLNWVRGNCEIKKMAVETERRQVKGFLILRDQSYISAVDVFNWFPKI